MDSSALIDILKSEMEISAGCTDPGSVCLAVSRARRELGCLPEKVIVSVSPNVYKNGISVGIPGTGRTGLLLSAAVGALEDHFEDGLAILANTTAEILLCADELLKNDCVAVACYEAAPDPLYIRAEVRSGKHSAAAIIMKDYSNIVEVARDGKILFKIPCMHSVEVPNPFEDSSVREIYNLIVGMDTGGLSFLIDAANLNKEATVKGLSAPALRLGGYLNRRISAAGYKCAPWERAQLYTAAACEARMQGFNVTIMAVSGSGNHGITSSLGILAAAEELGSDNEALVRALAISTMITVYIKGCIKRMTAFCGCAVAAATGVAAGTVYLLNGTFEQSEQAMRSVIGSLGGMFCDGAKLSCAYKLSTAACMAVQFAYMAMEGCSIPASVGIVGNTIEKTFMNLGMLNNPGMLETDRMLVSIIRHISEKKE